MTSTLHSPILDWYATTARDLPWRRPGTSAWAVLVSEFMLQQTPVARVLAAYEAWLTRWPTPEALAEEPVGEAVRQWARLGYPRRALRLHAAAVSITQRHAGAVPDTYDDLRALPGVGAYTAAAVLSFAYGQRHVVLDTNVRRVLSRLVSGTTDMPPAPSREETRLAASLLPADDGRAARWAAATMELGAVVCTARAPRCQACPVASRCAWRQAGSPQETMPRRRQVYAGSDRYVRGLLLQQLREAAGYVSETELLQRWPDVTQSRRALQGLLDDGLAVLRCTSGERLYGLPG